MRKDWEKQRCLPGVSAQHWSPCLCFSSHPVLAHLRCSAAAAGRSTMWELAALLLLVPSSGQAATLEKPILSLHPPWTTIFKGEKVTLRCDGYHPLLLELQPISTLWYLGHLLLPSYKKSIEVHTPGVYRCQTRGAPVSDPIHLSVSNDWLILQVPYAAVFEGEPLVMRCRGWYDKIVYKLHYYHDGQPVRYFHSSANYTVPQARASDSGRYQCSGTMRIPVESAPMFSAKVAVTVQELFQAPVLRVMGRVEARGAAFGGVVLRCETRLHPQKRDTPLQFAFYKYSRPVRRYDWDAEYTVPEPEVEELESYWCEAATATRSVRKRSPWLQLPGRGSPLDVASTTAPVLGNQPLSFRKPPVSRSVPSVPSVPNVTSAGPPFPAGGAPTAGPPACAPPTPLHQTAGALKPDVALLLREMQLLQGLLSRVVLELKETQAFPGHTVETSTSHSVHTLSATVQEIDAQGPASQHHRDLPESTGITDIAAAEETKSIIHLVSRSHRNFRSTASASLSPSICRLRASEWPDLAARES